MTKRDIHQEITDKVIAAMEGGLMPWKKDWSVAAHGMPIRSTGETYNGINVVMLWLSAMENGFQSGQWFTYKQAKALGGQVRKGEKGTKVVFFNAIEREQDNRGGDTETVKIPFLRQYTVFNASQIDELPEKYQPEAEFLNPAACHDDHVKGFFDGAGATIHEDGSSPCYRPATDSIHMPHLAQFRTVSGFYGTCAHEMIHWTGHKSRLDRFGATPTTADVAEEELTAELGALFLTAQLGCETELDNSAAYMENWLKALRNDKKFIFRAASKASKAVAFINDQVNASELQQAA